METKMKKYFGHALVMLTASLMLLATGCSEDKGSGNNDLGGGDVSVGFVQIVLGDETLEFLPGDSAQTSLSVIVRDRQGVVLQGVKVALALANPQLGLIEYVDTGLRDTTNALGRVECLYRSYAQPGLNLITAGAGSLQDTASILIQEAQFVLCDLNIVVTPAMIQVAPAYEDSALVVVRIRDCESAGIENVNLRLRATGGRFQPLPATDATGRTSTYWYSNGEYGDFNLWVVAANLADTAAITVLPLPPEQGELNLRSDTRRIKADGCVTQANLIATLEDPFGTARVGDTIFFGAPEEGVVTSYAITDSFGRALATFCEPGVPNDPDDETDSAFVVARYPDWGLVDTVRIRIDEASEVESITLDPAYTTGVAGVDSVSIEATVLYDDFTRVNGLWLKFYRECGSFSADSVLLNNGGLSTSQFWRFCNQVTTAGNPAEVWAELNGVVSNSLFFTVDPGDPRNTQIYTANSTIPINTTVECWAQIRDSLNNPVRDGIAVVFTTTAGTLSPPSPIPTGIDGVARVTLAPGPVAGPVTVKAELIGVDADSTVVTVVSGDATTIQLQVLPPSIQVRGTGGQSSAQLRADVRDANNNPAPDGLWVTFEILGGQPGGGININNNGFIDSAQTANGVAVATINAGTSAGPFSVQARARDSAGNLISATSSNGSVVSGPPSAINVYPREVGEDAGGSLWDLEVSAEVIDIYSNAVRCSTAVFFSVEPDTALIVSELVYTCNDDLAGDSRQGIAYTILRFSSPATFEHIFLTARTAAPNAVSETVEFELPLQEPIIDLLCAPPAWDFSERGNPSQIRCSAIVQDGHSTPINGATVYFGAQRGLLYNQATGGQQVPFGLRISGPNGSAPDNGLGECYVWLRGDVDEVFPAPNIPEITAEVRVEVVGYSEAVDAVIVNFQR